MLVRNREHLFHFDQWTTCDLIWSSFRRDSQGFTGSCLKCLSLCEYGDKTDRNSKRLCSQGMLQNKLHGCTNIFTTTNGISNLLYLTWEYQQNRQQNGPILVTSTVDNVLKYKYIMCNFTRGIVLQDLRCRFKNIVT